MGPPGADQHPAGSSRAPPLFLLSTPSAYPIQTNKPPRRVRHPIPGRYGCGRNLRSARHGHRAPPSGTARWLTSPGADPGSHALYLALPSVDRVHAGNDAADRSPPTPVQRQEYRIPLSIATGRDEHQVTGAMLTPKQARFVEEYLIDLNGKQAAVRAGYAAKAAEVQASRLLRNAKVRVLSKTRCWRDQSAPRLMRTVF